MNRSESPLQRNKFALARYSSRGLAAAGAKFFSSLLPRFLLLNFLFVDSLFIGFDFHLFVFNVKAQAVVDAHVLIGNPDESEKRDEVSAPVGKQQLIAGHKENPRRDVVTETIFTGE